MLKTQKNTDGSYLVTFSLETPAGIPAGVAGSFNDWDPEQTPMESAGNGVFCASLNLQPGYYEYKFVVGDHWILDDGNPNFSANDFGTLNSFFVLK